MPMPGVVSQGFILKTLGEVCSDHKPPLTGMLSQSQAFLADLKDEKQKLLALFIKYGIAKAEAEQEHLSQDWFNALTGWWPQAQPLEPLIRHGLIKALEVAARDPDTGAERKPRLSIAAYWICHPGSQPAAGSGQEGEQVEVVVCWSDHQVTFIIHSPEPPERLPAHILTAKDPIWIVKRVPAESPGVEDLYCERDTQGEVKSKIRAERVKTFDNRYAHFSRAVHTTRAAEDRAH